MSIFERFPNQSDYTTKWVNVSVPKISASVNRKFIKKVYFKLPQRIRLVLNGYKILRNFRLEYDNDFYQKW